MFLFISKRIGQTVPVVLLVSFFVFFIINVIPGDPTITVLGEFATPEQREIARQQYGFRSAGIRPISGLADEDVKWRPRQITSQQ